MTELRYGLQPDDIVVMRCVFGSHLYGTHTPNSDKDYKGIFIPAADKILLQKAPGSICLSTGQANSKNTADDVDVEWFSLHEFIKLALEGQTVAIDMLHCPNPEFETAIWREIREHRHLFYTTNMVAYLGYVRKQAAKYGVKGTRLESLGLAIDELTEALTHYVKEHNIDVCDVRVKDIADKLKVDDFRKHSSRVNKSGQTEKFYHVLEKQFQYTLRVNELIGILQNIYNTYGERAKLARENEGIDWKALSHAVRAGLQLKEIYETCDLKYPLKDRELILDIKLGKLDFMTQVKPMLENIVSEVEELTKNLTSTLPKKADPKFWEELIIEYYGNAVRFCGNYHKL